MSLQGAEHLYLSDDILLSVEKPERYIGGEVGCVMKDPDQVRVRFAFCFPDVYEIGMSYLGIQILSGMFNSWDDVWCERVYSPWTDLDKVMREKHIPLFMLESQEPVKKADFLGFTIQYEMCYTNILQVLDLSGVPLRAADRTWDDPLVIGGGPCTYNPEPIADFFDLFYIGEGEISFRSLFDLYEKAKDEDWSREAFLEAAARIPGIYVPSLYHVTYLEDGTIGSMLPVKEGIPERVEKTIVTDMRDVYYPMNQIVPFIKVTQDRVVLEILRGCIRGCRFCQAGQLYRPLRERNIEELEQYAVTMLQNTGLDEISLSSLSSSDYSELAELIDFLIGVCTERRINISLPSLRIDAFSLDVMSKVQDVRKSSLTFAPEAGSQRMRDVINKGLTEEVILHGFHEAFVGGWNKVKMYFMLGLPGETEEDILGIGDIANKVAVEYFDTVPKEKRGGRTVEITASTSFFVPKPFTPFQWAPMNRADEFLSKADLTRKGITSQLNQRHIHYNWHEAKTSVLEGVFARGDRKLSDVIEHAYKHGAIYDAWSETFKPEIWDAAFEAVGIDPEFYTTRVRTKDEVFPWDILDCGVSKSFLYREWERSQEAVVTPNCRQACQGCGAGRYQCDLCTRSEDSRPSKEFVRPSMPPIKKGEHEGVYKYRIKFSKQGPIRFIGHLDLMRYFQKVLRRSNLDIKYSEGYSPHQILSFALPLSVGDTSEGEYADLSMNSDLDPQFILEAMNEVMHEGITVTAADFLPEKSLNAMQSVAAAEYLLDFRHRPNENWAAECLSWMEQEHLPAIKKGKAGEKEIDMKPLILKAEETKDGKLHVILKAGSENHLKPSLLIGRFLESKGYEVGEHDLKTHRVEMYRWKDPKDREQGLCPLL